MCYNVDIDNILENIVMIKSHSEMAHILGLNANPFFNKNNNERWEISPAVKSIRERFSNFCNDKNKGISDLNFHALDIMNIGTLLNAPATIANLGDGGYVGYSTGWQSINLSDVLEGNSPFIGHAYTLHAVKEGDLTHFMYVNSGDRHISVNNSEQPPTVMVFTVPNSEAETFAKELVGASYSFGFNGRERISEFLNTKLDEQKRNPTNEYVRIANVLSEVITKKDQKTGNCTIANSNISWHFQIASNYMKQMKREGKAVSFAVAYEATRDEYKKMRQLDRIEAFNYLLYDKNSYSSDEAYFYNYLQALQKLQTKDGINPDARHIETIVSEAANEQAILNLINPLISDDFTINSQKYVAAVSEHFKTMMSRFLAGNPESEYAYAIPDLINRSPLIQWEEVDKAKDLLLGQTFKKLSPQTQEDLIEKDSSLIKYAADAVQEKFLTKDYNRYFLYASEEAKQSQIQNPSSYQQRHDANSRFNLTENAYLDLSISTTQERKTDTNSFLSKTSAKKEAMINNQMRDLCSYAQTGDQVNAKKAFESLCLVCSERRFHIPGRALYSPDTHSTNWLINKLSSNDNTVCALRNVLGIEPENLIKTVEDIVVRRNQIAAGKPVALKDGYVAVKKDFVTAKEEAKSADNSATYENTATIYKEFRTILESDDIIEPGIKLKKQFYTNVCGLLSAIQNNEDFTAIQEIARRGIALNNETKELHPKRDPTHLNNRIKMFNLILKSNSLDEALSNIKQEFPKYSIKRTDEKTAASELNFDHKLS